MLLSAKEIRAKPGDILIKGKQLPAEVKEILEGADNFEVIDVSEGQLAIRGISPLGKMRTYREILPGIKCWLEIIEKKDRIDRK